MRKFIKFIAMFILFIMIIFAVLWVLTSADRKIAKEFVISCCGSKTSEFIWYELFHDALKKEVEKDKFADLFKASQSYETVTFTSLSKSGSSSFFDGTAQTQAGCTSKVSVEVLGGKIISFDINPLCPK